MILFIVIQICVESEIPSLRGKEVNIFHITRKVYARNKEEAIGKFLTETKDIDAFKKMDIQCYDFSQLREIGTPP